VKRGRKSASELTVVAFNPTRSIPSPPPEFGKTESEIFRRIAASNPHLVSTDTQLLAAMVEAIMCRRAAAMTMRKDLEGGFPLWEKAARVQASIAVKLRLAPSSRFDVRTAGRSRGSELSVYELEAMERQNESDGD
jgi:hypothetical protein